MIKNEKEEKNGWKNSKYTKVVRITKENHEYLQRNKIDKYSMAGTLDFIINLYKKSNHDKK